MRCVAVACLLLPLACRFDPRVADDTPAGDDGGPHTITIVDDTTADFSRGIATDGAVTPWDTVEPAAFVVGGLHARGFDATPFTDTDSYDQALAKVGAPRGSGYRQIPKDWVLDRPHGIGVPNSDDYGVVYDGEILLPPGTLDLQLDADDRAIVQVALDRTNFGQQLYSHPNLIQKITLDTGDGGWFPIRAIFGEDKVNARFVLTYIQAGATVQIGADRLRSRVTNAQGLVAFGFDGQAFVTPRGEAAVTRVDEAFGINAPAYDLGMGFDRFSVRYVGQLLADTETDYTLAVDAGGETSDGFRLFVDGKLVASHWSGTPETPTATVHLARGWHDLLVDYSENTGDAHVALKMNGATVDPAHLRPAIAQGLTAVFFDTANHGIPDPGTLDLPMVVTAAPQGARIDFVDYGMQINNHGPNGLAGILIDCKGQVPLTLVTSGQYSYYAVDTRCTGMPTTPAQPFEFRLVDNMGNDSPIASASALFLATTYHGGDRMPYSTVWEYVSAAKPTPSATSIDKITLDATLHGAKAEIFVRTGADEAAVAAAGWKLVQADGVPDVAASAFVQYKIALTGDGWQYPVIDRVAIDYTAAN